MANSSASQTGSSDPSTTLYVLITGANSGLGLGICCRLIDEFLSSRPPSHTLHLIYTTRSPSKAASTLTALRAHLAKFTRSQQATSSNSSSSHADTTSFSQRVHFHPESLDLTHLRSVAGLARRLREGPARVPRLDVAIFNAGFAFWKIDWVRAVWTVLTDIPHSVTWPEFHTSYNRGAVTGTQFPSSSKHKLSNGSASTSSTPASADDEPPLGEIFTANVFGHYMLAHLLTPLLCPTDSTLRGPSSANDPFAPYTQARVIWISSLEAYAHTFSAADIQGLHAELAYESTKRLVDILGLTSSLPSTAPFVRGLWSYAPPRSPDNRPASTTTTPSAPLPRTYIAHPGICATSIVDLPAVLRWCMVLAFYLARALGSIWHTISPYSGAVSAVWLALSPTPVLDAMEVAPLESSASSSTAPSPGPAKWGSATSLWGEPRVRRTEVEGWGFGGRIGDEGTYARGRWRGARDLTPVAREQFEVLGRECWAEMENLRREWAGRLEQWEKAQKDEGSA